ncbi:CYTH and CHAD domain-containing protein [Nitrospirillum viridazoti]|uniref:CHAD domain-containing protein n=1 Tax=Nitrospirillum amazonense TaxID=28077 RepID=A0A560ILC7_9PROT|nr:CYTH and CHAD domain-containing protein [Nitrospirillum amazonense]TWB59737.1 CHAD domain-containing protein [Nitrospirillum amazonense]
MTNGPARPTPTTTGPDTSAQEAGRAAASSPAAYETPPPTPSSPDGSPAVATPPPPKRALAVREVEVKLAATPAALARLQALPLLARMADGPPAHRHQVTTYYDTPDLALAAHGMALRVRRQGDRRVQTVKTWASDAGTAAAAGRREWEWPLPVEGDGPDIGLLPAGIFNLLTSAQWAQVAPRFATDIERTALLLHPDPRTSVELALDQGEVRLSVPNGHETGAAEETTWPVAEVELELKGGRVAALFEVAAALHHHAPLRITTGSKADAGLRLLTGKPAAAVPAQPAALTPVTTVAEGFRHATRHALGHLLENATVLLESGDTQALREMAAASRRLDTAMRLLRLAMTLPPTAGPAPLARVGAKTAANPHAEAADALRRRLAPLRALLETARGWDRLAERAAHLPDRKGAAGLSKRQRLALDHAATQARRRVMKHLRGAGHTALVLDLAAWVEGGGWASPALDQPLKTVAPRLLAELQDKVARAIDRLELPSPPSPGARNAVLVAKAPPAADALERLRRRAQRLYETAEVCRGLYPLATAKAKIVKGAKITPPKRPATDPLAPLIRLHGAVTAPVLARQAAQLVAQLAKGTGPKARSTRLLSRLAQEEAVALAKLPATWRGYSRRRMFWMTGR